DGLLRIDDRLLAPVGLRGVLLDRGAVDLLDLIDPASAAARVGAGRRLDQLAAAELHAANDVWRPGRGGCMYGGINLGRAEKPRTALIALERTDEEIVRWRMHPCAFHVHGAATSLLEISSESPGIPRNELIDTQKKQNRRGDDKGDCDRPTGGSH